MKILVTGGAGFIGQHLVQRLESENHEVHVIDIVVPEKLAMKIYRCDVTHYASVNTAVEVLSPDAVIHLAAQVSVETADEEPAFDAMQNIIGAINVVKAAAENGVGKFIFASSAAVYGREKDIPTPEDEGFDPTPETYYGLSKKTAEEYIKKIAYDYDMQATVLRLANVYGIGQKLNQRGEGAVIPKFLKRMKEDKEIFIHGDGEQTRDFIYVSDVIDAFVRALSYDMPWTYNVGSGTYVTINDLFYRCAFVMNYGQSPHWDAGVVNGVTSSGLDSSRLRSKGWEPKFDLDLGLLLVAGSMFENDNA